MTASRAALVRVTVALWAAASGAACASGAPTDPTTAPAGQQAEGNTVPQIDADRAAATARQVFRTDVLPRQPAAARLAYLLDAQAPSTGERPCRDLQRQITASLGAGVAAATLYGSIAALDRAGSCWDVRWDGRRGPGLGAAVDAASGAALLLWEMPEG